MSKIAIIGAGPAGLMAAVRASEKNQVTIFEKNEKIGKKLFITGKGRCNITNNCNLDELLNNVCKNNKFLYSAFSNFDNFDTMKFFEDRGLNLKVERGNRVFPKSDKSSDVIKIFEKEIKSKNIDLRLNHQVKKISKNNDIFLVDQEEFDKVIIATGGLTYKSTGSTGDGYEFAKNFNHKINKIYPSLVGIKLKNVEESLQGLSLKNVRLTVKRNKKIIYTEIGEMMFTHFGITGPLVLSASAFISGKDKIKMYIDLKPGLDYEKLDLRILRDFNENTGKMAKNSLDKLLPKSLIPIVADRANLKDIITSELKKEIRQKLVEEIKNFKIEYDDLYDLDTGIVTRGGVDLKSINPKSMESNIVDGLYFCGEVLDIDALTGGFNLQIAWSTGFVAGGLSWLKNFFKL